MSYLIFNDSRIGFTDFTAIDESKHLKILEWRNNPVISSMMNNSDLISENQHLSFINKLRKSNNAKYWLATRKNVDCGVVYLHIDESTNKVGEWGYYVAPDFLGSGLGLELGFEAIVLFFETTGIDQLVGFVKVTNIENQRIQEALGFEKSEHDNQLLKYSFKREQYNQIPKQFNVIKKNIICGKSNS